MAKLIQIVNDYFLLAEEIHCKDPRAFFTPEFWEEEHRILGTAQGRGTTYFLQTQDLWGMDSVLRHYFRGGLIGKFNSDWYFLPDGRKNLSNCRSFAEFSLLSTLHQAELPVPKPLIAQVSFHGLGYRANIITQRIDNSQDLTMYLQKNFLSEYQWQEVGGLIAQLHDLQICHSDLNAHNILWQSPLAKDKKAKFYLIDFDKCIPMMGEEWKKANLQRLYRSFTKEAARLGINFNEDCWQSLLAGYKA